MPKKRVFLFVLGLMLTFLLIACTPDKVTYTVSFNSHGGPSVASQTVEVDGLVTEPSIQRAGYSLDGWYTESAYTNKWTFATDKVTKDMTLHAKWVADGQMFTVTFDAGAGVVLPSSREVSSGAKVLAPNADYPGYELIGWYKDADFINAWDFDEDVVENDMTLYAKWELIPEGTAITTQEEFYNLVNGTAAYETNAVFYLRYDLDFTGFDWDGLLFNEASIEPHTFILNGNGKTISNISFEATNQAGIIPRMASGSVYDLNLENIHVKGNAQGGVLVGRIVNGADVSFKNITVKDSSVIGGSTGVGGLIGHIQGQNEKSTVLVEQVAILNVQVTSNSNAIGGLVGDVESSKLIVNDVIVDAVVETTGERVGGILGEARRNSNSQDLPEVFVDNAVVYVNLTGIRYFGGIIGRADNNLHNLDAEIHGSTTKQLPGSISDVIVIANYNGSHTNASSYGHLVYAKDLGYDAVTNAYAIAFNLNQVGASAVNVVPGNLLNTVEDLTVDAFEGFSELWVTEAGKLPSFANGLSITLGHKVTIHLDESSTQVQYVRDGQSLFDIYFAEEAGEFVKWTSDSSGENELTAITEPTDAYPQFVDVFVVNFESNEGSAVESQEIIDGLTAEKPLDPTRFGFEFEGWYTDQDFTALFDFDTPITEDITLYAKWKAVQLEEFTVSFETNGANETIEDQKVLDGALVLLPALPTKDGFIFNGWYTDQDLTVLFTANTPVTADMTLYAGWKVDEGGQTPEGIAIQTAEEFYNMATGSNGFDLSGQYYLAMDIDFTGFVWEGKAVNFSGELNGNGKTLKNLTFTATSGVNGGLFHRLDSAKVHNFTIDNFDFNTANGNKRGAFVAGQVQGASATYIEHIKVVNSTITGDEYVASIVGRATSADAQVHINNIVLDNVSIAGKYSAGLIADLDGTSSGSTISDIWAKITINGTERVGGLISRARSSQGAIVSRVYMDITLTADKWAGGIVGDVSSNALTINDVFVTGTMTTNANSARAIAGNNASNADINNAYEFNFTGQGTGGAGGTVVGNAPDQAWWIENLNPITQSVLWVFNETSNNYELKLLSSSEVVAPTISHVVSFDTNGAGDVANQVILDEALAQEPLAVTLDGYSFVGWFVDLEDELPFDFNTPITTDLTLYAKFVDDIAPTIEVSPTESTILLATDESFKLIVKINDANPYALEVDHSFEGTLPEFSVYAQATSTENPFGPYGSQEAMDAFITQGVEVLYDSETSTWTIDFGAAITAMFAENGVTFYLVAKDSEGNMFGSMDPTTPDNTFTFNMDVISEEFTVQFDVDGGSEIADITVLDGALLTLPEAPTKEGFDFVGWFTDVDKSVAFDDQLPITADMTLYAKWVEAVEDPFEGYTAITTAEGFIAVVSSANAGKKFYVANDLDFTDVPWVQSGSGTNFAGLMDGNHKKLMNITITTTGSGVRGGIFQRVNGATIINMVIENAQISIEGRAGIIVGGSDSGGQGAVIDNITILNSNVSGTVGEGTGIIIGQMAGGVWDISNIRIDNSHAINSNKNAALIGGRLDATLTLENVFVTNSSAKSDSTGTDAGVAGLIGYLNHDNAIFKANNIVLDNITLEGRGAGFAIGYNNKSSEILIENMYANVTFVHGATNGQHGFIGRRGSSAAVQVVNDVYALVNDAQTSGAEQLDAEYQLDTAFSVSDFETKLPTIFENEFFESFFTV